MRRQITQEEFEAECFRGWPEELTKWGQNELRKDQADNRQRANLRLARASDRINDVMGQMPFELIENDDELREKARRLSRLCADSGDIEGMRRIAIHYGITPPHTERCTRLGQYRRLCCERWWRRKLRTRYGRLAKDAMRNVGLVRRGLSPYITDFSLRRRRRQRHSLRASIERATVIGENGEEIRLSEAVASSIANPAVRRAELMTRLRGFEAIARAAGHTAIFFTLTAPSAFHAQLSNGHRNPRYGDHTVRQCMAWLNRQWARARSAMKRAELVTYGFRVAEPHHDGTPHFHILLFLQDIHGTAVTSILKRYWLQEYADEPGAMAARVDAKQLDLANGSAVGYISKYIAKNIDGYRVDGDHEGELEAIAGAERVDAWASTHGIRQFQQIGGPPVGLWRELRRLRKPVIQSEIEPARAAADESDYAQFVSTIGGVAVGRRGSMRVWAEQTGELSAYDDLRGPTPIGVLSSPGGHLKILHPWTGQTPPPDGDGTRDDYAV